MHPTFTKMMIDYRII